MPSQWETTLHCKVISHWLGASTNWSLLGMTFSKFLLLSMIDSRFMFCQNISKWLMRWYDIMAFDRLTHWPLGNLNEILDIIFKQILVIDSWGIFCEIVLIWMSLDFTDDQSTLVQVMAWCHQATSHYLSQCWPRSLSPYGVTRPQWVNTLRLGDAYMYQWTISALVHIMVCHLVGTKPLPKPMTICH